jgi:hypothetical protein
LRKFERTHLSKISKKKSNALMATHGAGWTPTGHCSGRGARAAGSPTGAAVWPAGGLARNGKGGDLIRFLADAQIPKDKRPSLLASGSLCSAVVNGKGGDRIRFLADAQIAKDKRPSILASDSLCSAVVNGKGGDLIRFLDDAQLPKDKRPSLLRSGSSD